MWRALRSSICWPRIRWWPTRLYRSVDGSFKIAIGSLTGTHRFLAAAKVASCGYLLTEDFEAGQNLDGVEVVNPFQRRPDDIL
jgi:hypothetical protein